MKKYMPGFVPINFQKAGKILLAIGLICILIKLISSLTNWFETSNYILYFGSTLVVLSLYLILVVPKE